MSSAKPTHAAKATPPLVLAAAMIGAVIVSAAGAAADGKSVTTVDSSTAFADLDSAVGAMQTSYTRAHPNDLSPAGIALAVTDLKTRWTNSHWQCPSDYAQTLEDDAQQIMAAVAQNDPSSASQMLSDVNDDLSIKEAHAKAHGSSAATLGDDVAVTVKTERNGQDLSGYLIRCNDIRNTDFTNPDLSFNAPTSPTAQANIAPGRYTCWAEYPPRTDKVISEAERIGLSGETTESIQLPIP